MLELILQASIQLIREINFNNLGNTDLDILSYLYSNLDIQICTSSLITNNENLRNLFSLAFTPELQTYAPDRVRLFFNWSKCQSIIHALCDAGYLPEENRWDVTPREETLNYSRSANVLGNVTASINGNIQTIEIFSSLKRSEIQQFIDLYNQANLINITKNDIRLI